MSQYMPYLSPAVSRRTFLRTSAELSAVAATLGSIGLPFSSLAHAQTQPNHKPQETIKYSACLVNCGSRCPLRVHVKDDVVIRVSSEQGTNEAVFGEHQIRPCLRGRAAKWRVYNHDRLKYPMKRVGKRGEGKFERISWDEATSLVAEKLKYTIEKYGNEAIYYQYGSGSTGANLQGRNTCKRLLNLAGGFLDQYGTYSTAQIETMQPYIHGAKMDGSLFSEIKNSDLVVMFGQNLAETRMSGGGQLAEIYDALAHSNPKVILIDPRHTDSVTAFAGEWIPIRPGTDAALIAALGYTLIQANLIDDAMVNTYSVGWDEASLPASAPKHASYKSYILGLGADGIAKTPEWASHLTGIPAARIKQLAHEIAAAKAAWISQGWGIQRTLMGEHAFRAITMLPLMTGHFGKPGTNIGTWGGSITYPVPGLAIPNPVKTQIPAFLWTDGIARGKEMTAKKDGVRGKEQLSTSIKFLWNYASNVTGNQHSDLNKTHNVLADESLCEFILVWDNHMTPSARYADLLLPDVTTLESDDLINNSYASGAYHYVTRLQSAINPLWENRPTYDVLVDIADKMGLKEPFTEGRTYQDWIKHSYNKLREQQPHIPSFEDSDGMGVIDRKVADSFQNIAFREFREDPMAHPLKTPSGKIEVYSERLANIAKEWDLDEHDKIPPIPEYCATLEGIEDHKTLKTYPFQMTGFHTKGHCHSTYPNIAQLVEAAPDVAWINTLDAKTYKIKSGDTVEIFNDRGSLHMKARVTARILPSVIAVPQGAWAKTNHKGVDIGGCINRLTMQRPSSLAKGNPQHTNLVDIRKVY